MRGVYHLWCVADENLDGTGGSKAEPVAGSMDSIDQLQQAQTTKAAKPTWQPPSYVTAQSPDSETYKSSILGIHSLFTGISF